MNKIKLKHIYPLLLELKYIDEELHYIILEGDIDIEYQYDLESRREEILLNLEYYGLDIEDYQNYNEEY